jgi:hypothetical protein
VYGAAVAVLGCDRACMLLAAGGHAEGGFSPRVYLYDTEADRWAERAPLPSPRFGMSLLARLGARKAFGVGGFEQRFPSTSAAAYALHRRSLAQTAEYDLDADSWWVVPTERQWQRLDAFDWREDEAIASAQERAFDEGVAMHLPPERWAGALVVPGGGICPLGVNCLPEIGCEEGLPWCTGSPAITEAQWFLRHAEYTRPDPARCRHGRGVSGCLIGHGIQRDQYGYEVADDERRQIPPGVYEPTWSPPLDFDDVPTPAESAGEVAAVAVAKFATEELLDDYLNGLVGPNATANASTAAQEQPVDERVAEAEREAAMREARVAEAMRSGSSSSRTHGGDHEVDAPAQREASVEHLDRPRR